jgi:nicotinamide riboside kinase
LERKISYDKYFLFDIDVPWVADGMRDLKDNRQVMFDVFKHELDIRNISYAWVQGTYDERELFLKAELNKILKD